MFYTFTTINTYIANRHYEKSSLLDPIDVIMLDLNMDKIVI